MLRKIFNPARLSRFQRTMVTVSSSDALVSTEVDDKTGYATVTLNRAPVNSLSLELMTEIVKTVDELERSNIRGMVLTSFSNKVFCAGLDIMEMVNPDLDRLRAVWTRLQDTWASLYGTSFPTVALINGHAPAGGCLLALCCEYRVMCNNFNIGLNETQLGLAVPPWLQGTMRQTIGTREAEIHCIKGTMFNSQDALKIGLVDELAAENGEAMQRALHYLNTFKQMSPYARSATKLLMRNKDIEDMKRGRKEDVERFVENVMNSDFQNGLTVYLQSLKNRKNK
ncbi:enoyl-CoA delta isomerase 1, mitochondrial-like [Aedes albopictus]|uniref:Hydroxyacyl-coa dehydrogenase/enoyl-coa hydratase n=1 Tax=Aedes albopictus TaxID=7160 RepID=A0ABM1ZMD8_AEDAL